MYMPVPHRRYPVGAEVQEENEVWFRVWAPAAKSVRVVFEQEGRAAGEAALEDEGNGYFSKALQPLTQFYRYRINDGKNFYPDPASRYQPFGPHGSSQIIDARTFRWSDAKWPGVERGNHVLYEMHIGTFTKEGTWQSAAEQLAGLSSLGITVLEVMPVSEFPGRFGWGYDGVDLFAPSHLYGTPDDFRAFIDRAHSLGLGVILDVVYNHLGPDGNYLKCFSPSYFADQRTEWGEAINFDGKDSQEVRTFFIANAVYWIEEFHLDGLRLDATQQIFDSSKQHIVAAIGQAVRRAAGGRKTLIIAENEPQDSKLVRSKAEGGAGLDCLWNDDFHHSARVMLTGRSEAYFSPYAGTPQEFVSSAKYGYLFQGQRYEWQKKRRGIPARGLSAQCFVNFIQNHDQIANSARGERVHVITSPGRLRAMTALLFLSPGLPMLFQGQEFGASAPFLYFADHNEELASLVAKGRREFLEQFDGIKKQSGPLLRAPHDSLTFELCKIDWSEKEKHEHIYRLHAHLIRLRRTEQPFVEQYAVDGAVLNEAALLLRYFGPEAHQDRLLLVNFGRRSPLGTIAEPLLAPPAGRRWKTLWSSEDAIYGGWGATEPEAADGRWTLPGESAVYLAGVHGHG